MSCFGKVCSLSVVPFFLPLKVNSGILRPEDKGHVSRSIREHVESVVIKHKTHQQGPKDSVGKENIPTSSTKEHNVGEDKEKERGKEAQRQNLAHAIIPAASTTVTPVPPTSEPQSVEEQALVSVVCYNFSFNLIFT